jgi:hypothetical protein
VRAYFEHVGPRTRVQAVLNALVEAPFFYREDDPDLFAFLRRYRADFARFYEELYDWRLVVDTRCARLYKTRWHNRALKPSQHDVFDLTRRDDCLAFLLVLEFYERLLDERNVDPDDPDPVRFEFGELFAFARERLRAELLEQAPDDDGVRKLLRNLMPILLRYRFLREIPPDRDERDGLDRDRFIYECLPGLHHYDVRALGESALRAAARPGGEDGTSDSDRSDASSAVGGGAPGDEELE